MALIMLPSLQGWHDSVAPCLKLHSPTSTEGALCCRGCWCFLADFHNKTTHTQPSAFRRIHRKGREHSSLGQPAQCRMASCKRVGDIFKLTCMRRSHVRRIHFGNMQASS